MKIKKRTLMKLVWMGIVAMTILSTLAWTASFGR
jgi:hypothetical protein